MADFTLAELVEKLTPLLAEHGDKHVSTEGCDCWGEVDRVEVSDEYVLLRRS